MVLILSVCLSTSNSNYCLNSIAINHSVIFFLNIFFRQQTTYVSFFINKTNGDLDY